MSQSKHVEKLLAEQNLEHVPPVPTPITHSANVSSRHPDGSALSIADHHGASLLVCSLSKLVLYRRLKISYKVSILAKKLYHPSSRQLSLTNRVVRYVAGMDHQKFLFSSSSRLPMTSFGNSDKAGSHETKRSTTGIVINVNDAPIFGQSNCQTLISISSSVAEYIAALYCEKQVL